MTNLFFKLRHLFAVFMLNRSVMKHKGRYSEITLGKLTCLDGKVYIRQYTYTDTLEGENLYRVCILCLVNPSFFSFKYKLFGPINDLPELEDTLKEAIDEWNNPVGRILKQFHLILDEPWCNNYCRLLLIQLPHTLTISDIKAENLESYSSIPTIKLEPHVFGY